jgi:hypothetical protein
VLPKYVDDETERFEPKIVNPPILAELISAASPSNDQVLIKVVVPVTDRELPPETELRTETELPSRVNDAVEKELIAVRLETTDNVLIDPAETKPAADKLDPNRAKEYRLSELPTITELSALKPPAACVNPTTLKAPYRTLAPITEHVDCKVAAPLTET